jgi:hypothetical protein
MSVHVANAVFHGRFSGARLMDVSDKVDLLVSSLEASTVLS